MFDLASTTVPNAPTNCSDMDPEIFFDPAREAEAKNACASCWFQPMCIDIGAKNDYGIWGGVQPLAPTELEIEVLDMRSGGFTLREVAEALNLTHKAVRSTEERFSDEQRSRRMEKESEIFARDTAVRRLRDEDELPTQEIADRVGLSASYVRKILAQDAA